MWWPVIIALALDVIAFTVVMIVIYRWFRCPPHVDLRQTVDFRVDEQGKTHYLTRYTCQKCLRVRREWD